MAIAVTIGGVTHTAEVYRPEGGPPSFNLTMQLGSDWTCEFPVFDTLSTSSAYRPTLGQIVVITDGATTIFRGTIVRLEDKPIKGTGSGTLTMVSCRAYNGLVDQIIVNASLGAGFTREDWVDYFFTNYLSAYGITIDAAMSTGDTLEAQSFEDVTLREAFNHLSTVTGDLWRITPGGELQFFAAGEKTASYSLTAANKLSVGPVSWSKAREKYVNSVTLRYGTETTVLKTFTATGTGSVSSWVLDYDPALNSDGYIISEGVVTEVGVAIRTLSAPGGGGFYTWTAATNTLSRTAGNLGAGVVITLVYSVQFPQTVTVEDAGLIASDGKYAGVFEAPEIFEKDPATELATGLLRRYSSEPKWVRITTRQAFVMPGDQITLTFSDRTISGAHIITEVRGADVFMNGHMQYDLTCLSGGEKQDNWTDQLRDVLGSVGGARSAGGTITGSIVPNFSGHFDSDVIAYDGKITSPEFESKLSVFANSAGEGPAVHLGRFDRDYRWVITGNSDHGSTPGSVGKLRFHPGRRGSNIEAAMMLAEPDTGGTDDFMVLPGANANLYLGDYAALMSGLSPSDSRIEGILAKSCQVTDGYLERSRTVRMGEWTSVSFSAGNFTANGSMTWTVASGDQITYQYMLIGKTLFVNAVIDTSTVGGTPNIVLQLAVPGGFTAAKKAQASCVLFDNGVAALGFSQVLASGTLIQIGRADGSNLAASTDNTYVRVMMQFEVS